jgi:hypothetical protein
LRVVLMCDERCRVVLSVSVSPGGRRLRLEPGTRSISLLARKRKVLSLRLSRKAIAAVRRGVKRGGRPAEVSAAMRAGARLRLPASLAALAMVASLPFGVHALSESWAAPNPGLAGVEPNSWVRLGPQPSERYIGRSYYNCSETRVLSNPVGRSYSGVAYGEGKIFHFGGGHHSHPGNDVELYDVERNVWEQQYRPECLPSSCATDPSSHQACAIQGGPGSRVPTPRGRPYTEHTFQKIVYDPIRKVFIAGLSAGTFAFDPALRAWTQLTGVGSAPDLPWFFNIQDKLMIFDPDLGTVVWFVMANNRYAYRFDYATSSWVRRGSLPNINPAEIYSAYDPHRRRHLVMFVRWGITDNPIDLYFYDAVADSWTPVADPPTELRSSWPSSIAYDIGNARFVAAAGRADGTVGLWAFDGQSQWTELSPQGTPPQGSARFARLWYDPINEVFFYVNTRSVGSGGTGGISEGNVETWAYRP